MAMQAVRLVDLVETTVSVGTDTAQHTIDVSLVNKLDQAAKVKPDLSHKPPLYKISKFSGRQIAVKDVAKLNYYFTWEKLTVNYLAHLHVDIIWPEWATLMVGHSYVAIDLAVSLEPVALLQEVVIDVYDCLSGVIVNNNKLSHSGTVAGCLSRVSGVLKQKGPRMFYKLTWEVTEPKDSKITYKHSIMNQLAAYIFAPLDFKTQVDAEPEQLSAEWCVIEKEEDYTLGDTSTGI